MSGYTLSNAVIAIHPVVRRCIVQATDDVAERGIHRPITNFYYFLITKLYLYRTDIKHMNPYYPKLNFIGNSDKNVLTHRFL
jgi:hypothetical protein